MSISPIYCLIIGRYKNVNSEPNPIKKRLNQGIEPLFAVNTEGVSFGNNF